MTPEERSRAAHPSTPSSWQQMDATFIHLEDQAAAAVRDVADAADIDLSDPETARIVRAVTDTILVAGQELEPDHKAVANSMYVFTMAWRESVRG